MNEYDSNRIVDLMTDSSGYIKTNSAEDADLVILNTCSIRDKAQQKVYSELGGPDSEGTASRHEDRGRRLCGKPGRLKDH